MGKRYSEMNNAAVERGNYLDDLGDSLNNVSVSAGNYLSQAKNAAVSVRIQLSRIRPRVSRDSLIYSLVLSDR